MSEGGHLLLTCTAKQHSRSKIQLKHQGLIVENSPNRPEGGRMKGQDQGPEPILCRHCTWRRHNVSPSTKCRGCNVME